jgi:hypothetical protein
VIRRVPANLSLVADTTAKTLHLVVETFAASGEGDVEVHRIDLTAALAGAANAEKRRLLRHVFSESAAE